MPAQGRRQERCGCSCERCGQGPPRRRDARPLRDPQRVRVRAKPRVRDARASARPLRTRSLPGSSSKLRRGRRLKDKSPGAWGEDLALRYLIQNGYTLVERNYRTRRGEIDLIVRKEDTLAFVEVKLRRTTGFGDPREAVTPRKQNTLRSVAEHFLYIRKPHYDTLRFYVIGILADRPEVRVHHIEDAF